MAIDYYELPADATMRDLILSVRADESIHRDINHKFSELNPGTDVEKEVCDFLENDSRLRRTSDKIKDLLKMSGGNS